MRTRVLSLALLAATLLAGAGIAQEAARAEADLEKARVALADRDHVRAVRLLTDFVLRYGTGERVEEAHVLLLRARLGDVLQNFGHAAACPYSPCLPSETGLEYAKILASDDRKCYSC